MENDLKIQCFPNIGFFLLHAPSAFIKSAWRSLSEDDAGSQTTVTFSLTVEIHESTI